MTVSAILLNAQKSVSSISAKGNMQKKDWNHFCKIKTARED